MVPHHHRRSWKPWLALALLVGAGVRLHLAWSASIVARDGVEYLRMARDMADDWRSGIGPQLHFGYPLLVELAHPTLGGLLSDDEPIRWQRTGQLLSLLGGVACIGLVFALGRRLHSTRCGLLAAFIWALLPDAARLSADALTDMPHLALVLVGLLPAMTGLRSGSPAPLFLCGLLCGAAYAMRPEGAELAVVASVLALLAEGGVGRRLRAAGALIAGFCVLGGAYMLVEGDVISKHRSLFPAAAPQATLAGSLLLASGDNTALVPALKKLLEQLIKTTNGVWLVWAVAFAFLRGRRLRRSAWTLPIALCVLHIALLLWLHTKRGYLSGRHVMLLDVVIVILAAAALTNLRAGLVRRACLSASAARRLAHASGALIVAGTCACLTPWLMRDIQNDRRYIREAAEFVRTEVTGIAEPVVVADDGWVPYYAGLRGWALCPKEGDMAGTPELARASLLIMDVRLHPPAAMRIDVANYAPITIAPLRRFNDADGSRGVVVYRVQPAGSSAG